MSAPLSAAFYIDENLQGLFADTLVAAGVSLVRCRDLGLVGVADAIWIPKVTKLGLVIVTGDVRIRYRTVEKAALMRSGARVLFVTLGKATHSDLAQNFVVCLPDIVRFVAKHPAPWLATLSRPSQVGNVGRIRKIDLP